VLGLADPHMVSEGAGHNSNCAEQQQKTSLASLWWCENLAPDSMHAGKAAMTGMT
jgi:hypothetical protein